MSDPMSATELAEIRARYLTPGGLIPVNIGEMMQMANSLARLLAEIDRQRELMREAADEIHSGGFGPNWCCRGRQHSLTADDIMEHAADCIVSRLRTAAGEK